MEYTVDMLRQVVKNDFTVPYGIDPFEFALDIRTYLRSENPELRDQLTYSILYTLIIRYQLSAQEMAELLTLSTDELCHDIGDCGTDTVFGRSFAVLIVAAILSADKKTPRLSATHLQHATESVINYAFAEQDRRDFVDGKGWAHSVAHTADALGICGLHPNLPKECRAQILEAIRHLATVASPLAFEDDDRLAYPVLRLVLEDKNGLIDWKKWIRSFEIPHSPNVEDALRLTNGGRFLRSLYLLLLWEYPDCPLLGVLEQQIKRLHGLYHYGALPINRS